MLLFVICCIEKHKDNLLFKNNLKTTNNRIKKYIPKAKLYNIVGKEHKK